MVEDEFDLRDVIQVNQLTPVGIVPGFGLTDATRREYHGHGVSSRVAARV